MLNLLALVANKVANLGHEFCNSLPAKVGNLLAAN